MITIKKHDSGAAVEDVQQRLAALGYLPEEQVTGVFGDITAAAVERFCQDAQIPCQAEVNEKIWAALVDAGFTLGDRTLYLRMPHFHGHDVLELQQALSALGFSTGGTDGIFGAYTELALRKFQQNLGLFSDGIAGAYTFQALHNLQHSWVGKEANKHTTYLGFARAADVLEREPLCLFGTCEFTRAVASRMSNLALATNPSSKLVSADALSVAPSEDMMLIHIALPEQPSEEQAPRVSFEPEESLALRLDTALHSGVKASRKLSLELPGNTWEDAGFARSAQHYAITLLDALCKALDSARS